ncbi:centrosome-associated protein 350 isoform X3 [Trichomycterus rosablanca]|uniref:centrosome-associated protein 350 isoform X3 n=1 Tax=Trichomycterus rosablanca TaxID=2290929 RepID=UPI002F353FCE
MGSQSRGDKATGMDSHAELSSAWRNLNQSKAALRHIENQLEVAVVSEVLVTSLKPERNHAHGRRGRRSVDDDAAAKNSPDKSSRSPLRASTQGNTHTSHRPASPPPDPSQSRQVYDRDARPLHSASLDSTRSSAVDATTVRVLNDPPPPPGSEVSPGSARLEKLRRRQADEKLEKLKERIRKQREQLEEAAGGDGGGASGRLERPPGVGAAQADGVHPAAAKVRKVAPAPPAPIYKGFNSSEVRIRAPGGTAWAEQEFKLNRQIYKDLTHHLAERVKHKSAEKQKQQEKKTKPVRKIHRSASVPEPKPAISTSSWREGQKLVKMMLGPLPQETRAGSGDRPGRTAAAPRSSSAPGRDSTRHPEKPSRATGGARSKEAPSRTTREAAFAKPAGGDRGHSSSVDLLSVDIRGILDDLRLDAAPAEVPDGVRRRRAERSPSKPRAESAPRRRRHYDSDAVRRFMAKQQEERKRKQAEERRSLAEEHERRSQRLQELYKKQKEGVVKLQAPPPDPNPQRVDPRLQETYTKMLLQHTMQRARPVYQPSGESDKENKRLEPLSPSTSEVSEHTPSPLCRADLVAPPSGQFFSHLLSLEPDCHGADPEPVRASGRMTRVEALKACAASLSSRIESEARRLVGHGAGGGKPPSPPERERPHSRSRIPNGASELPGVGSLYGFSTGEAWGQTLEPHPVPAGDVPMETHESSGGSISEGLLSDGGASDPDEAPEFCPIQNGNHARDRISLFKKEAGFQPPYRPLVAPRAPWEELNKGSPHSVINIFTKNLHKYTNGMDLEAERSPARRSSPSAHGSLNGVVYEDDFISSRGSSQSASRRNANSHSNARSSAAADEKRENGRFPHSSTSTPLSSPSSARSVSKRASERSDRGSERTLVDSQRSASSFASEHRRSASQKSSDPNGALGGVPLHSHRSLASEVPPFPRSPAGSPRVQSSSSPSPSSARDSTPRAGPSHEPVCDGGSIHSSTVPASGATELHFAPVALQQRLSVELNFLDAVEESARQLSDVERARAVSLAQQESVSLAQILKAQQQRQERELQLLRLKAEQEALETQKHLQETKEKTAQAHAELCMNLLQSHQKALVELQESSSNMVDHQTEAVHHLREVTEMARSQMPSAPSSTPVRQPRPQTDSSRSEVSTERSQSHTAGSPHSSPSEGEASRKHTVGSVSVSEGGAVDRSSSVDEEANTAAADSLQTDRADSASLDYSQKFDESVTEDELERSFRSLLPSESHWRGSVERKRHSDEEQQHEKSSAKDGGGGGGGVPAFSADQHGFSEFTMTMVKQYMQEEEVRSQHHSSLLRLRHRALKEKTRAELAWLELQKKRLRDKGEDDKMPPIRKKQRGLLLKLQQEQAEIRRLQEVNRAARRERKLLLKQQEEIEKIQHTTLKLREKLRNAGDTNQRSPVSGESDDLSPLTELEVESRSHSPVSVSGSETSSIMKQLKKMSYHTDERFLTQRELRLVHWRQQVEAELRRTDGAESRRKGRPLFDRQGEDRLQEDGSSSRTQDDRRTARGERREGHSEDESSLVSSIHTLQECESPQAVSSGSKVTVHSSSRKTDQQLSAPTSEATSDQSDIEGRVLALRAELRRRKAEVQRLKREQRVRHKEKLKAQEASLLKQLESYNSFIEKTKAELSDADAGASAKPQIKSPSSGSHKSRTKPTSLPRSEPEITPRETSVSHESESEVSERIHTESPASSDEDPPTVTPTPVSGSPERSSPPRPHRDDVGQSEGSVEQPGNRSVASSPRSELIEELGGLNSGISSDSSGKSPPALDLKLRDKNEKEAGGSGRNESVERSEDVESGSSALDKLSGEEPSRDGRVSDGPEFPAGEENSEHDGYKEDFESLGSSNLEHRQTLSPSALHPEERSYEFSFSSEEDIEEHISIKSESSTGTERQRTPVELDLLDKPARETLDEDVFSPRGSPLEDEMPSFSIGDRVLVGKVQPGTLRFKGQTSFASGSWAGVELDESEGHNDGTRDGVAYFHCRDEHGVFAPPDEISHLPEKIEAHPESTVDEDSSIDERSGKTPEKNESGSESVPPNKEPDVDVPSEKIEPSEPPQVQDQDGSICEVLEVLDASMLDSNEASRLVISKDEEQEAPEMHPSPKRDAEPTPDVLDLLDREELQESSERPPEKVGEDKKDKEASPEDGSLNTLADTVVQGYMTDVMKQFEEMRKTKEDKIRAANQRFLLSETEEQRRRDLILGRYTSPTKTESFHTFFDKEQEEVSSPELCTRSESPAVGQEELARRLAELELNREFLHTLGDDQDWFDEDFGLGSREHTRDESGPGREEPAPTPTPPAGPARARQQEEPAMLVPHGAEEVEKLVSAALLEVWSGCGLDRGGRGLTALSKPGPSEALLGDKDEEQCVRSYRQAVFDLTWEFVLDIYAKDPNDDLPQWIKPCRVSSSLIHRINDPTDLTQVQAFVSREVLKLCGLRNEQNHRTDWQKMLKFGRKKRDRVDHILVQELHEEEALWVNYDEDELFVKMQLADGIFDALLKDTLDVLARIHDRRSEPTLS